MKSKQTGFSIVQALLLLIIVAIIGATGWYVIDSNKKSDELLQNAEQTSNVSRGVQKKQQTAETTNWKVAKSPRAKFSIKYPDNWSYSESEGSKDNVEHIAISANDFRISIDSFSGKDPSNGGISETKCTDCKSTTNTQIFTAGKIGSLDLDTVAYSLDNGLGNAIILRQPGGIYYLPSPSVNGIYTSFRGISVLGSEQLYQSESTSNFMASPDYSTALKILKTLSY